MSNVLQAIKFIIDNPITKIKEQSISTNRINAVGQSLENYIQGIFITTTYATEEERLRLIEKTFSYLGNTNNPPDLMLRDSDAIEIKKIESPNSALALNSSYPKNKLFLNSSLITQACKDAEQWIEKDMLYIVGHTLKNTIKYLWFIYGDCFCADKNVYERIINTIRTGINQIENVELAETNELARVNRADPLGITYLRVRGMWHIENPNKIFNYLKEVKSLQTADFKVICLLTAAKFNSFSKADRQALESHTQEGYFFGDVKIKNPNNPAQLMDCKLITYRVDNA
jgi:NgoPII restriction endonuclease